MLNVTARILWISAFHNDWEFVFDALRMRLLGSVELSCFRPTESGIPDLVGIKPCYYFYTPDLLRYTSIDGVILAGPSGAQFVLSDFGSRSLQLRSSKLFAEARATGSVVDVDERVSSGDALAILAASARGTDQQRWAYLKDRFGLLTSQVSMSDFLGVLRLSFDGTG